MKDPRNSDSDTNWEKLVRRARADVGPPANLPALLRAVEQAPRVARETWTTEFCALFGPGRARSVCVGATPNESIRVQAILDPSAGNLKALRVVDFAGKRHAAAETGAEATVWVFSSHDCPICNSYAPELNRLQSEFSGRPVPISRTAAVGCALESP